jgi:predicted Rossmann fold flavoprotein
MYDICIIGGGPAGMSAAITAKNINPHLSVCIIEKNPILGKKIFATGNGKCNLSHQSCLESGEVLKFFDKAGIFIRVDETGRMYPASEQASDVVNALTNALIRANVDIRCDAVPKKISKIETGFLIELPKENTVCKRLLIATGGKAGPQYGNIGEGYTYSKQLGHHVNRTYPVLSPLECAGNFHLLKGIRSKGNVRLLYKSNIIATEKGEIQFTEDGLSGICVFNLSRFIRLNPNLPLAEAIKAYTVSVDFIPSLDQDEVKQYITERASYPNCKTKDLLLTVVHPGISADINARAGICPENDAIGLSDRDLNQIAIMLKRWECQVIGVKGWKKAQCTGGGIPLSEVDAYSGESKMTAGLYFAGELLDYDGPSGGFNLHFAWDSGIKAGKAMADETI